MNDGTNDDEPSGDKGESVHGSFSPRVAAKGLPEVPRWRFVDKDQFACNCPSLMIVSQVCQHGKEKLWILHSSCGSAS